MRTGGAARRAAAWGLACAAGLLVAGAAWAGPEVGLSGGTTLAVNGSPGSGGASGSVLLLWPFEDRWAFGLTGYADDFGTALADLFDPNTGGALGTVASRHRWGFGVGWRAEARLAESPLWRLQWGADFGYQRQEQDVRGTVNDAVSGLVVATGPTLLRKVVGGHSIGLTGAWKHMIVSREANADRTTDWAAVAATWRWRGAPRE